MPTCLVVSKQPWSVTQQTRRGPCLALIAKPKYDYILKEENNEICPKWWQPGISLQKISHGNRTCQMSRCQPRPDNRGQSAPASSGYSGRRSETEERSGGSAIVPAMGPMLAVIRRTQPRSRRHQPKDIGGQLRPGPGCQLMQRLAAAAGVLAWVELQTNLREF